MDIYHSNCENQKVVPDFPYFGGYYYRGRILYFSEGLLRDTQPVAPVPDDFPHLQSMLYNGHGRFVLCQYLGPPTESRSTEQPGNYHRDFYLSLLRETLCPDGSFERMSNKLSSVLKFQCSTPLEEQQVITAAQEIQSRMPQVPMGSFEGVIPANSFEEPFDESTKTASNLIHIPDAWLDRFLLPGYAGERILPGNPADPLNLMDWQLYHIQIWENLQVNRLFDSNTLNIIQSIAEMSVSAKFCFDFAKEVFKYVQFLSIMNSEALIWEREALGALQEERYRRAQKTSVLEHSTIDDLLQIGVESKEQVVGRIVAQCFLWTAWQRATTLLFYLVMSAKLRGNDNHDWVSFLSVGGFLLMENLSLELDEARDEQQGLSYMCNWAFELLRTNRSSLTLDFRMLFQRFQDHFGQSPARCVMENSTYRRCDGNAVTNCKRFVSSGDRNQTMHALDCNREACYRISWDRESYIATGSARAVDLSCREDQMRYTTVEETLAISHVWSHGQGGRPEDGINICLYRRYCTIARRYSCSSFWIDSACIPDEPELRTEAIKNINPIFQGAKITLVCDKDLMSCPVVDLTIVQLETVLSAWLVSDWSVRAWTLLEGVRGSQNLHLLCANDDILPANTLVTRLVREGSVSLATLSLATLPFMTSRTSDAPKPSFELAGSFLAHRHASRLGDMTIIWSLLCGDRVFTKMEPFLLHVGTIRTGFLMSSAPRLATAGFRWAPESPNLKSVDKANPDIPVLRGYHSYDGGGSVSGIVTGQGFTAKWLVWEPTLDTCPKQLYIGYRGPVLHSLLQEGREIALLQSLSVDGTPYTASDGRGDNQTAESPLVALCHKAGPGMWIWEDVYLLKASSWQAEVDFEVRELILI